MQGAPLNWVVSWKCCECSLDDFIDCLREIALIARVSTENTGVYTASKVAIFIASTFINCCLKDTCVPTVDVISMVSVTGGISVRIYEGLT